MEKVTVNAMASDGKNLNILAPIGLAAPQPVTEVPASASPVTDPKEQLHLRVLARIQELRKALAEAGGHNSTSERGRALILALNTAQSAMSGGWERVGEAESAKLSKWLGTTEDLRVTSKFPAQSKG
jgi:hypothetical protein